MKKTRINLTGTELLALDADDLHDWCIDATMHNRSHEVPCTLAEASKLIPAIAATGQAKAVLLDPKMVDACVVDNAKRSILVYVGTSAALAHAEARDAFA